MSTVSVTRKKIGRPPVGSVHIGVRVPPDLLVRLDTWIANRDDPKPSRPEALRALADAALGMLKG